MTWDATVDTHNKKIGIGVIVRNSMEDVLATLQSPRCNISDLVVAKYVAALPAIVFAKKIGCYKVELEGDAL